MAMPPQYSYHWDKPDTKITTVCYKTITYLILSALGVNSLVAS